MWRREKGLRREDILHAVPLVCVMVLKDGVLVLLTVMVVGVELNGPRQAALGTYWPIKQKHTSPLIQPYRYMSNQTFVLVIDWCVLSMRCW